MTDEKKLSPQELQERVRRFYGRYGEELEQIKELLAIKLRQLSLAYTLNNRLPKEAIIVAARVKTQESFLKKLAHAGWPQFYYPTEIVKDMIGARVICWFLDDSYGMLDCIKSSNHFVIHDDKSAPIRDYVKEPQFAGYRAIHVFADVTYDSVLRDETKAAIVTPAKILCEVQIRTKLQDAWADITHEFFYKARNFGITNREYETLLADLAERLTVEDKSFMKFRNIYQQMADAKQAADSREGFRESNI
jgi:putative GTP pyrophosphokinase